MTPIPPATAVGWTQVAPMLYPRVNHYLVNLPDGTVMALGGSNHVLNNDPPQGMTNSGTVCECVEPDPENPVCTDINAPCNLCNAVRECERYVPWTNQWEPLARMNGRRVHHWVALLLPNGSVFAAGGQRVGAPGQPQRTFEIYNPPYFNDSNRPVIVPSSIPSLMQYNKAYNIVIETAMPITKVRLIRPSAVTHSIDMDARMLELSYLQGAPPAGGGGSWSTTVRVKAPQHADLAPPGYYMLWLCTGANGGTPSAVGEFVKIGP